MPISRCVGLCAFSPPPTLLVCWLVRAPPPIPPPIHTTVTYLTTGGEEHTKYTEYQSGGVVVWWSLCFLLPTPLTSYPYLPDLPQSYKLPLVFTYLTFGGEHEKHTEYHKTNQPVRLPVCFPTPLPHTHTCPQRSRA